MDPDEHRARARELWEAAATGWGGDAAAEQERNVLPVAHWMVDAIAPQPGQTVLELAGGAGTPGLLAAELLRPGGKLIETDGAEAMVEVARRAAEARGVQDTIEFRTMELEWIDATTASIDAVLCRFGYMLVPDPEAALRETRRVLRPAGRLALAVWDQPETNLWIAVPNEELGRVVGTPQISTAAPTGEGYTPDPFGLSAPGALRELLLDSGFEDVVVEGLDVQVTAPSLDALWERLLELSPSRRALLADLPPADVYRLRDAVDERWAPYVGDDGAVSIPARALVAAASA